MRRLILFEILSTTAFFLFYALVGFRNFWIPFSMTVILSNLSLAFFSVFRLLYPERRKPVLEALNLSVSVLLSVPIVRSILGYVSSGLPLTFQDFVIVILISSIVISALVSGYSILRFRLASQRLEAERLRRKSLERHVEMLRRKFDPHFLSNSLGILAELIHENPERAEDYAVALSDYYRKVLSAPPVWTLSEELEFVGFYLELQKLRFGDIEWEVRMEDGVGSVEVPAMFLQPAVENAIVHGDGGRIEIEAGMRNGKCEIVVKNPGRLPENFEKGRGLRIIEESLGFFEDHTMDVREDGGKVVLRITFRG